VSSGVVAFVTGELLGRSWCAFSTLRCSISCWRSGSTLSWLRWLARSRYIAFYAVGAYLYALLASPHFGQHWPVWAILPMGAMLAAGFGVLLGAPTLKLRGDYLAIVTLGFGEIIRIFLTNLNTPINITNGPQGVSLIDPITIGGFSLARHSRCLASRCLDLHLLLSVSRLDARDCVHLHTSAGLTHRPAVAIREDEVAAAAMVSIPAT